MLKHMLTSPPHGQRAPPPLDVMDLHPGGGSGGGVGMRDRMRPQVPPTSLNLSINMSQRLNHSHTLNLSALSTSKHSLGGNSSSISPGATNATRTTVLDHSHHSIPSQRNGDAPKMANGGLNIPRKVIPANVTKFMNASKEAGVKEMLTSLGLLCLVSLLLALLSLIFLLKISPVTAEDVRGILRSEQVRIINAEEYIVVYEVTLALCALSLSLNLCCLLVCAIQFLFAVKLVRSPQGPERTNKYLRRSAVTRVCAVGGFFVSIPVFLTGIILYTFIQFHSTPAIVTSVFIGLGIIFCGCAMVHNVFVWQTEKTNAVRYMAQQQEQQRQEEQQQQRSSAESKTPKMMGSQSGMGMAVPQATLDLSTIGTPPPHELSTLV